MARLILEYKNDVLRDYPFRRGGITIGRQRDNTIEFDNLDVSGYHARVDRKGSEFILTDLQSTNGTFVNNERVVSMRLVHGDEITIGVHTQLFIGTERARIEEEHQNVPLNQTIILRSPAKKREPIRKPEIIGEKPKPRQLETSKSYQRITPFFITLIILVYLGWLMLSHGQLLMRMIFDRRKPERTQIPPGFENPAASLPQSDVSILKSSGEWSPSETQSRVILNKGTLSEETDEFLFKLDGILLSNDPKNSMALIN